MSFLRRIAFPCGRCYTVPGAGKALPKQQQKKRENTFHEHQS